MSTLDVKTLTIYLILFASVLCFHLWLFFIFTEDDHGWLYYSFRMLASFDGSTVLTTLMELDFFIVEK